MREERGFWAGRNGEAAGFACAANLAAAFRRAGVRIAARAAAATAAAIVVAIERGWGGASGGDSLRVLAICDKCGQC